MNDVIFFHKNISETPLQAIQRLCADRPELRDQKLSYAGRLDPMATGILPILVGEEVNQNREEYLAFDKEYHFKILLGISTDTGDILGKVISVQTDTAQDLHPLLTTGLSQKYSGTTLTQKYPAYSSKTVDGKSLWQWARDTRLSEIEIPSQDVKIYNLQYLGTEKLADVDILRDVEKRINLVRGDFRQDECLATWRSAIFPLQNQKFTIAQFSARVSSGFYIRQFVIDVGSLLNIPTVAWGIRRVGVGL